RRKRALLAEENEVDADGKQKIRCRPCQHHDESLPQRFFVKGAPAVGGRYFVLGIFAQQLDEAAEGDQRNAVFGVAPAKAHKARRESQREAKDSYAAQLGHAEMPELVNEHERSDEKNEIPRLRPVMHARRSIADGGQDPGSQALGLPSKILEPIQLVAGSRLGS